MEQSVKNGLRPQLKFRLGSQYIKDLSFENPNPLLFMSGIPDKPGIELNVDIQAAPVQDRTFEVGLKLTARASVPSKKDGAEENKAIFVAELLYAALFILNPSMPEEEIEKTLLVDCPSFLFPFARRLIADLTSESGLAPLLLEPINFEALYAAKKEKTAA